MTMTETLTFRVNCLCCIIEWYFKCRLIFFSHLTVQQSVRNRKLDNQLFMLDRLPVLRTTSKPIQKLNSMNFQTGKH